jgi:predicted RND superfamily exporter protein
MKKSDYVTATPASEVIVSVEYEGDYNTYTGFAKAEDIATGKQFYNTKGDKSMKKQIILTISITIALMMIVLFDNTNIGAATFLMIFTPATLTAGYILGLMNMIRWGDK